jgi:hypothetical protein
MDLRRLRIGELGLGLAGLALLVSLFLPWYGAEGGGDLTGWEGLSAVDVALALVAAAALSVPVVTAGQRVSAVPIALDAIVTLLGLVALLLVLIRLLALPDAADGREPGIWLALAGAAGIVAAGGAAMRDERLSPPGRHTDATGRPVALPPEVEVLPAPPRGGSS